MNKKTIPRRKFLAAAASAAGLLGAAFTMAPLRKDKGMLTIRRSNDRGLAEHGWLKSRHTFSFADYYDPQHLGFGPLRVINEDRIAGGTGFDTHPHNNMEIISYVVSGGLRHRDSMGNVTVIKPGDVQRMSAGSGVSHSEYNDEKDKETHFFQIWITPNERGVQPGYGQKSFLSELASQKLTHVISKDGKSGSISIHQDADMYIAKLKKSEDLDFDLPVTRRLWIQIVKGEVSINGEKLQVGDAASTQDIDKVSIKASEESEMIIFELP